MDAKQIQADVLSALHDDNCGTTAELAAFTNLSEKVVHSALQILKREGKVKFHPVAGCWMVAK